ncbi:MAG: ribonuclease H-like domain-containing protein [Nitrospira sp.]|nr:ribonuclease H-like domain-containing protein [Nitrospira sp.]
MLTSSFIFLPGVGPVTERRWWQDGVLTWNHFLAQPTISGLSTARKRWYDDELRAAHSLAEQGQFRQLASRFPRREHWRLYETCRSRAGYLDIETTGTSPEKGDVTVVGLHHHGHTLSLVRGETLTAECLQAELDHCDLLVTFFGSRFDIPYLCAKFPELRLPPWHFDLCFAARRLALRGGLKQIEQEFGIERNGSIQGLDGWDAVRLWSQWVHGDKIARDQLLAYNRADTEHLVLLADRFAEDLMTQFGPSSVACSTFHPAHTR